MKIAITDPNGFKLTFETPENFDAKVGSTHAADELQTALSRQLGNGMQTYLALMALLSQVARTRPDVTEEGAARISYHLTQTLGVVLKTL